MVEALTKSLEGYGIPRHLITDQEPVFRSSAFADLLERHSVKHRFGAVGKQGSIAVTERAIKTLKYEWLYRVPLIKNYNHLEELCHSFEEWYNRWRPHMTLQGSRPGDVFAGKKPVSLARDAKRIPPKIERHGHSDTPKTGMRTTRVMRSHNQPGPSDQRAKQGKSAVRCTRLFWYDFADNEIRFVVVRASLQFLQR